MPELNLVNTATENLVTSNPAEQIAGPAPDWRLKLSLAPGSTYLYKTASPQSAGILYPLSLTDGVIFPYTPRIETQYSADYEAYNLTHTNYTGYFYKNSHVGPITVSCDFTAQSSSEADYLLAVIHFFRSITKMFYGQDGAPVAGTPPPVCYLNGLGNYQFNNHPVLVSSFTYSLPDDVDYIRAGSNEYAGGLTSLASIRNKTPTATGGIFDAVTNRLVSSGLDTIKGLFASSGVNSTLPGLGTGGTNAGPGPSNITGTPTYVPTKIGISITLLPVISRNRQATEYSTRDYASGAGLTKGFW